LYCWGMPVCESVMSRSDGQAWSVVVRREVDKVYHVAQIGSRIHTCPDSVHHDPMKERESIHMKKRLAADSGILTQSEPRLVPTLMIVNAFEVTTVDNFGHLDCFLVPWGNSNTGSSGIPPEISSQRSIVPAAHIPEVHHLSTFS